MQDDMPDDSQIAPHPPASGLGPTAPVVGVGAVVWKDDMVLLVKRGNPPRKGLWSLPGGRQILGETVFEAAEREIREEAGLSIRVLDIAAVVDLIDREDGEIRFHYTVIDVVSEWVDGEAVAGDDAVAVAWVPVDRLDDYAVTDEVRGVVAVAAEKRYASRR